MESFQNPSPKIPPASRLAEKISTPCLSRAETRCSSGRPAPTASNHLRPPSNPQRRIFEIRRVVSVLHSADRSADVRAESPQCYSLGHNEHPERRPRNL